MIRALLAIACISVALHATSARAQAQENAAEAALASAIADYERLIRIADPVTAGQDGDREALRRLPDARRASELAMAKDFAAIGERLARIKASDLSQDAALNHEFLSRLVAEAVEEAEFDFGRIAFENDSGFHTLGDYLARTTTIGSRDDAEAWLARLEALPTFYDQNIANLRRGVQTKYTQPKIVVGSRARRGAQARGNEGGGELPPAAVCAHARQYPGGGAGGLSGARADARFANAFFRRSAGSPTFWRATIRLPRGPPSPGAVRQTARRAIAFSSAARRRRR